MWSWDALPSIPRRNLTAAQWFVGGTYGPPKPEGWATGGTVARTWRVGGGLAATRFGSGTKGPPIPDGWPPGRTVARAWRARCALAARRCRWAALWVSA